MHPLIINQGKMVDASFTVAPRQRNTREERRSPHEYLFKTKQ
jgi:hypothetical protein